MKTRRTTRPPIDPGELVGGCVSALRAVRGQPTRIGVFVEGKRAGVIDADDIGRLGLSVGVEWTGAMCARVADAAGEHKARQTALRMLGFRARSRGDLVRRLVMKKHDPVVAQRVVDRLAERGLIDDRAFAEAFVRSELSRSPAGARLLEGKLRQKGVEMTLARDVVRAGLGDRDQLEDALATARKHARVQPAGITPDALRRRVLGKLARRGFAGDVVFAAWDLLMKEESDDARAV